MVACSEVRVRVQRTRLGHGLRAQIRPAEGQQGGAKGPRVNCVIFCSMSRFLILFCLLISGTAFYVPIVPLSRAVPSPVVNGRGLYQYQSVMSRQGPGYGFGLIKDLSPNCRKSTALVSSMYLMC